MFLTSKARYALMIVTDIAKYGDNKIVKPVDIAMRQDIKISYVQRICNLLKNSGLLISKRGINGGYQLVTKEVSILDIIIASGESVKMTMCSMKNKDYPCSKKHNKIKCLNHGIWSAFTMYTTNYFKNITLGELVGWLESDEDYRGKILEKFNL